MNNLLAQIVLAAGNNGAGWLQILVFVVVAAVYALGSILKARANKLEEGDEEQLPGKPTQKPLDGVRGIQPRRPAGPAPGRQYRPQTQPPHRKVARPQPVARKFPAKKDRWAIEPLALEPLEKESKELISKPLEDKDTAIRAKTPQAKYFAEALLDYADPDEIRRAILHYEILGKPLSLRPPSADCIIGL